MGKPQFIDLFAGCGGLSLGLTDAGWQGVLAVERDEMAFETLRSNLIDRGRVQRYVWVDGVPKKALSIQTLLKTYKRRLRRLRGKVTLIAGGPPCQGFSSAGKRVGADPRNQLLLQYVNVVAEVLPNFILIENVKGITSRHRSSEEPYAEILLRKLDALGYACTARVVKASDCGVPQERPRFIILGVRRAAFARVDLDALLPKLWDEKVEEARKVLRKRLGLPMRAITCSEALSDLEMSGSELEPCSDAPGRQQVKYKKPLTTYQKLMNAGAVEMDSMRLAKHSQETKRRFEWIQANCDPGENVGRLALERYGTKKYSQVVLDPAKPSRTLTTLPDDLIHYSEPRILSVREYARLQSFPDWFAFTGKYTTGGDRRTKECPRYTQIGNAVAPFVAHMLGIAVNGVSQTLNRISVRIIRKVSRKRPFVPQQRGSWSRAGIRVWRAAG